MLKCLYCHQEPDSSCANCDAVLCQEHRIYSRAADEFFCRDQEECHERRQAQLRNLGLLDTGASP